MDHTLRVRKRDNFTQSQHESEHIAAAQTVRDVFVQVLTAHQLHYVKRATISSAHPRRALTQCPDTPIVPECSLRAAVARWRSPLARPAYPGLRTRYRAAGPSRARDTLCPRLPGRLSRPRCTARAAAVFLSPAAAIVARRYYRASCVDPRGGPKRHSGTTPSNRCSSSRYSSSLPVRLRTVLSTCWRKRLRAHDK